MTPETTSLQQTKPFFLKSPVVGPVWGSAPEANPSLLPEDNIETNGVSYVTDCTA